MKISTHKSALRYMRSKYNFDVKNMRNIIIQRRICGWVLNDYTMCKYFCFCSKTFDYEGNF